MPTDTREERLARRIADLYANDAQFAAAQSSEAINAALDQPGLRLPQIAQTVMEGYADRPALGQRAVQLATDPRTGSITAELLPRFDTITYGEVWARVRAVASALTNVAVRPGDRVCILGFSSVDYTVIDMALIPLGAISVPLQTSSPVTQRRPIVAETEPSLIASSVDHLDDAVEVVLIGFAPVRLVVFDYRSEVDDHRKAFDAAKAQLADAGNPVIVETLTDVLDRGRGLPDTRLSVSRADDPLTLLVYTSGSTGRPKGACIPNGWSRTPGAQPSARRASTAFRR
jgi:fatty acid CoA ligase FadD9